MGTIQTRLHGLNLFKVFFLVAALVASLLFVTTTITSTDVKAIGACGSDNDFVQGDGSAATPNTQKCYDPANGNRELDSPTPAGAPITNPPPATDAGGTSGDGAPEEDVTCAIEKVGWILCPIIETVGRMGDRVFQFLAKSFLEVEAELVSSVGSVDGNKSGTYYAWELARNMANIMFIAAFLIIILSQVTGRGIDNYGIKKTLPRLIIAAIAVNASFYICQAMVDLSNILGYEIQNFLVDVSRQVSDVAAMPVQSSIDNQTKNGTLGTIAAWVLGATAVVWLLLPILLLGVTTVLVTCIVIIVILLLRKAFIVLLVVASPVAFVMYLLPNTEKYFKQWLGMFWKLLMVFPVVGLLFGGGQLASSIVLIAGTSGNTDNSIYKTEGEKCIELPSSTPQTVTAPGQQNPVPVPNSGGASVGDCGTRSVPMMLGIVAAGIAVAPLLAVWAVLKAALQGMGALGGKITGAVDTYTNKGGAKASERFKKTAIGRGMEARKAIKQNYKDEKFAGRMGGHGMRGRYTRIASRGIQGNVGRVVGGSWGAQNDKLTSNFAHVGEELEEKALKERQASIRHDTGGDLGAIQQAFMNAAASNDTVGAKAAESMLLAAGAAGADMWLSAMNDLEVGKKIGTDMSKELQKHTRLKHANIKGTSVAADAWSTDNPNNRSLTEIMNDATTYKNLSGDHVLGQSKRSLDAMQNSMSAGSLQDTLRKAQASGADAQALSDLASAQISAVNNMKTAAGIATRAQGYASVKVENRARIEGIQNHTP